jgi:hypothetical protein
MFGLSNSHCYFMLIERTSPVHISSKNDFTAITGLVKTTNTFSAKNAAGLKCKPVPTAKQRGQFKFLTRTKPMICTTDAT